MRSVRLIVETNSLTGAHTRSTTCFFASDMRCSSAGLALLAVILHAVQPNTDLFTAPTLAIGKVYSNTLLVALVTPRRFVSQLLNSLMDQ